MPGLQLYRPAEDITPNYAYMPVVFDPEAFGATRDEVSAALAREGISARRYFYPLTSEYDCYGGNSGADETPVAYRVSTQVLTLPMFADMAEEDVERVCSIVIGASCG